MRRPRLVAPTLVLVSAAVVAAAGAGPAAAQPKAKAAPKLRLKGPDFDPKDARSAYRLVAQAATAAGTVNWNRPAVVCDPEVYVALDEARAAVADPAVRKAADEFAVGFAARHVLNRANDVFGATPENTRQTFSQSVDSAARYASQRFDDRARAEEAVRAQFGPDARLVGDAPVSAASAKRLGDLLDTTVGEFEDLLARGALTRRLFLLQLETLREGQRAWEKSMLKAARELAGKPVKDPPFAVDLPAAKVARIDDVRLTNASGQALTDVTFQVRVKNQYGDDAVTHGFAAAVPAKGVLTVPLDGVWRRAYSPFSVRLEVTVSVWAAELRHEGHAAKLATTVPPAPGTTFQPGEDWDGLRRRLTTAHAADLEKIAPAAGRFLELFTPPVNPVANARALVAAAAADKGYAALAPTGTVVLLRFTAADPDRNVVEAEVADAADPKQTFPLAGAFVPDARVGAVAVLTGNVRPAVGGGRANPKDAKLYPGKFLFHVAPNGWPQLTLPSDPTAPVPTLAVAAKRK